MPDITTSAAHCRAAGLTSDYIARRPTAVVPRACMYDKHSRAADLSRAAGLHSIFCARVELWPSTAGRPTSVAPRACIRSFTQYALHMPTCYITNTMALCLSID